RFKDMSGEVLDIRAPKSVQLLPEELTSWSDAHGGTFSDLLTKYLTERSPEDYPKDAEGDNLTARSSGPPPLLWEGEKVQPSWLFQFLLNPQPIRPMAVLRMPRFNMSEDEARTLVNYFAALERMGNPGIGLTYPYLAVPQREDEFWARQSAEYVARLKQD